MYKKISCCLKYVLLIIFILTISHLRYFFFVLFAGILAYDIVRHYKKRIIQDLIIIGTAAAVSLTHYPVCKGVEILRFYLFKSQYNAAADRIVSEIRDMDDVYWDEYATKGLFLLTADQYILYMKQQDHIVVIFPTNTSFGVGYVYYCDQESQNMLEKPSEYWPKHTRENDIYEYYKSISEEWAYIQFY